MKIEIVEPTEQERRAIFDTRFYCVDCDHHVITAIGSHKCRRITHPARSLVTGQIEQHGELFCDTQRASAGETDCGPDARHFQSKGEKS